MQQQTTVEGTLRYLRLVHGMLLFSMVLYPLVAQKLVPHQSTDLNRIFPIALTVLSVALIGIAVLVHTKMTQAAFDVLRTKPDDAASLSRWRQASIISYALSESVVLFGVALWFLGGTLNQSVPFYIAGPALMLFLWPRRP